MKILLLGKHGQVGRELHRSLALLGHVVALSSRIIDLCGGDLSNLAGIAATVRLVASDVIFNATAYTAVDNAESEPELAGLINAQAPDALAVDAAHSGTLLVHYSTDYVFDGSGAPRLRWARSSAWPAALSRLLPCVRKIHAGTRTSCKRHSICACLTGKAGWRAC